MRAVVAGLVCLAVAGVTVATLGALQRRVVRTTAVVESTERGAFVERVAVVYDIGRPGSARLAATAVGGSPFLHPLVLLFGGLGLLFLVAAAINLAVEI